MKGRVLSGFTDILVGLVPLALFVAIDSYLLVGADMRKAMLVLAILCLEAGFLRGLGAPASTLLKALLVGSVRMCLSPDSCRMERSATSRRKSRAGTAPAPDGRTAWPRTCPNN